jgi:aminotransferase in exopolysaccharide biosynthesis
MEFNSILNFIRQQFPQEDVIPLHRPCFRGNERNYVRDAIDTTYVSSVGAYVNDFEDKLCQLTGSRYAIAVVNGTSALHLGLLMADVFAGDEVLTQSLTFIATCNAISYIGATPVFIDIDRDTLGMSPIALHHFLKNNTELREDGHCYNRKTGRRVKACVPMHTFGLPCRIDKLAKICKQFNVALVEDAAESIGSKYKGKHTGTFGLVGTFSFNGNKTITCGGGGALITNDSLIAKKAKHLTTQAKISHPWNFVHDRVGYNYRMPNLNAALGVAQLEQLDSFVNNKRELAEIYWNFFSLNGLRLVKEIDESYSNYWLNTIIFEDSIQRNSFLEFANKNGVMCRPAWELMHRLSMFQDCYSENLSNSEWIADRIVNIPSSVRNES